MELQNTYSSILEKNEIEAKETITRALEPSKIEQLQRLSIESKRDSENLLLEIQRLQTEYETAELKKRCYNEQINRLLDEQDYTA